MKMKILIPVLAVIVLVGGTAFAAQAAKPGDTLFPVKKATETIRVSLAASETDRANLQNQFAQERLTELNAIEQEHQQGVQTQASVDAQTQAKTEVSNAIDTLTQVQADLKAKGNLEAANAIGDTISRLQTKLSDDEDTNESGDNQGGDHGDNHGQNQDNNPQNCSSKDSACANLKTDNNENDQNNNEQEDNHGGTSSVNGQTHVKTDPNGGGIHFDNGTGAEIGD